MEPAWSGSAHGLQDWKACDHTGFPGLARACSGAGRPFTVPTSPSTDPWRRHGSCLKWGPALLSAPPPVHTARAQRRLLRGEPPSRWPLSGENRPS